MWEVGPELGAAWGWAAGAGLAFIAGLAFMLPLLHFDTYPETIEAEDTVVVYVLVCLTALGSGFVSRSWLAVPALAAALCAGGWVAGILWDQVSPMPGGVKGFQAFLLSTLIPAAAFLLAGTALGARRRMAMDGRREQAIGGSTISQWAFAISLTIAGAFFAGLSYTAAPAALATATVLLASVACLLAGIDLRSWAGLIVTPIIYVAVAVLVGYIWVGPGGSGSGVGLFVTLPAVAMAAIGTAFGMYRARWRRPAPTTPQELME